MTPLELVNPGNLIAVGIKVFRLIVTYTISISFREVK